MKSFKRSLFQKPVVFFVALFAVAIVPFSFAKSVEAWYCGPNTLCLFENINYGGAQYNYYLPSQGDGCVTLPSSWRNRVSSIRNNAPNVVQMYANTSCVNYLFSAGNFSNLHWYNYWGDNVESFCVAPKGCI